MREVLMSLSPQHVPAVLSETARIVRAAFPHSNLCLQLRDVLGAIYADRMFAALFPTIGQHAHAPCRS